MPTGHYAEVIERLRPGAAGPATSSISTGACSAGMTASSISPSASAAGSASPPARRSTSCGSTPPRAASWSGRARRCAPAASGCATSTGSATARSTRRCRTARDFRQGALDAGAAAGMAARGADGGIEVELVAGEEGVSPGQACVFYDAAEGQARVLGGGFIASTVAIADPPCRTRPQRPRLAAGRWTVAKVWSKARKEHGRDGAELDNAAVAKAYARWAPIYDLVFGAGVRPRPQGGDRRGRAHRRPHPRSRRRHRPVAARIFAGPTALSASICRSRCCARPRRASREHRLANVDGLAVMDAQHLGFPDGVFDVVVAQYVITAVPDPRRRSTSSRACSSPAARSFWSIISAPRAACAQPSSAGFAPLARRLGWRPEFPWARLVAWAARHRRRAPGRTPPDAAARAFLADPVRAGVRSGAAIVYGASKPCRRSCSLNPLALSRTISRLRISVAISKPSER